MGAIWVFSAQVWHPKQESHSAGCVGGLLRKGAWLEHFLKIGVVKKGPCEAHLTGAAQDGKKKSTDVTSCFHFLLPACLQLPWPGRSFIIGENVLFSAHLKSLSWAQRF